MLDINKKEKTKTKILCESKQCASILDINKRRTKKNTLGVFKHDSNKGLMGLPYFEKVLILSMIVARGKLFV